MHPNFCPQSLLCSSLPLLFLLVVVSFCRNSEALHFRLFTGLEIPPSSHSQYYVLGGLPIFSSNMLIAHLFKIIPHGETLRLQNYPGKKPKANKMIGVRGESPILAYLLLLIFGKLDIFSCNVFKIHLPLCPHNPTTTQLSRRPTKLAPSKLISQLHL